MAQIPMGNFATARAVPAPEQGRVVTPDASNRGALAAAGAVQDAAQNAINQKNREDQALARVKASNALIDRESQLKTIGADITEKMRTGQITWDKAEEAYNSAASKLTPLDTPGLDEVAAGEVGNSLKRLQISGLDRVREAADGARIDSARADITSRMDLLGKDAALPGANVDQINARMDAEDIDIAGRMAWGEAWEQRKQEFKDDNWTTHATQRVIGAREGLADLKQIEHDLTAADGFYAQKLDPNKRNQLLNTVTGRIYQVQEHQQRQAEMREMKAIRVLDQMDRQAATGIPPSPAEQKIWQASLAGTSLAGEYSTRIEQMNEVQKVLRMPLGAQQTYIQEKRAQVAQTGASVSEVANLDRLDRAVTANMQQMRDQPLLFNAARTGSTVAPLDMSAITTPEGQAALAGQIAERFDTVNAMRQQYGPQVARMPLLPQEADMLKAVLSQADDAAKLQILGVLSAASPSGSDYKAVLQAVSADEPVTQLAGMAQHAGLKGPADAKTGQYVDVAKTLLAGGKVLADKSFQLPAEKEMRLAFDAGIGASLPAGTAQREQAYTAFRTLYAGLAQPRGLTGTDAADKGVDDDLASEALLLATGGIGERAGAKVIKPYGMSDEQFDSLVDSQLQGLAERSGFPLDQLEDMPLMPVPGQSGAYYLMNGGRAQIDPKTNQPMVVKAR